MDNQNHFLTSDKPATWLWFTFCQVRALRGTFCSTCQEICVSDKEENPGIIHLYETILSESEDDLDNHGYIAIVIVRTITKLAAMRTNYMNNY